MTPVTKGHLALLATNILFAINFTAVKYLINGGFIQAFGLNIIRVAITALLLWAAFLFKKEKTIIHKKDVGRLVLCALTGIAINQLLFVKGLSLTWSIHASLLMLTTPILITLIAAWLLKERLNNYKIAGLALGIAGALLLVLSKEKTGKAPSPVLGDVFIILNAIAYTLYFILVKPLMKAYDPVVILRIIFTTGFFIMLPFCYKEFADTNWQLYSAKEFIVLALIVIGGTFCAYLFNIYGIKILGASVAGAYIYAQPVFAATIAIFFGGENLSLYKIFAAALIFAGVYLANKTKINA